MSEKKIVVDKLRLTYEGLFSIQDLYKLIDVWFREKGYDKKERIAHERVTPEGKYIEIEIEPWKKYTDYVKSEVKIRMIFSDIREVEVEQEGVKIILNQGKIQMVFDGYLTTDYEHRWEQKPLFFFLRTVFDKYIYRIYTEKYEHHVIEDVNQVHSQIKSFLNLYRYGAEVVTEPPKEPYVGH